MAEQEKKRAIGCINIDMAGEAGAGDLVMKFGNSEHNILSLLWNHISENDMAVEMGVMTDESAFYYGKIPGITIENQNPDFALEREADQFQFVDYEQLLYLTNELTAFVTKFDSEYYERLLEERPEVESNIDRVPKLKNVEFQRAAAKVVENGFIMDTCFYYKTVEGEQFRLTLRKRIFWEEENTDAYRQISDGENAIYYKTELSDNGNIQASFYNDQYFGIIEGELDEEECVQILTSFYEAEYW